MSLSVTALILGAFLNGLNEGILWTDTEELWCKWPRGTGPNDLYHPLVRGGQAASVVVLLLSEAPPIFAVLGGLLLAFACREISMDAVIGWNSSIAQTDHWRGVFRRVCRWRKQSLLGIPRYPLAERLSTLLLGGWMLGL